MHGWIIDWTRLVKGSYIKIVPTIVSMSGIVGVEVVTARETALTPRNPADVGSFSEIISYMTIKGLSTFEGALATWMTTFELPLGNAGWYATEAQGGGIRRAAHETGTLVTAFTGLRDRQTPTGVLQPSRQP
ncbi:hypothetical protein N7448_010944 [Penicillium atrosanguineum]|nr:hypothetical protein N7448_010944 [Penicillium atrosanguineum]